MDTFATTIYVVSDEVLRALQIKDDPQSHMSNAEVITFAVLAAKYFYCNFKRARFICENLKLFNKLLSNSRLNRRIRSISWDIWNAIFRFLALVFTETVIEDEFAVDSFPVSCCAKSRIDRRKIFLDKEYIGYAASKKQYFCGVKVHMVVTGDGKPIELAFRPASVSDVNVLWELNLNIPSNSKLYADGAYNSFELEDILGDEKIQLLAKRGQHIKNRARTRCEEKQISSKRQIVETAFSCITDLFPRNLKFRTEKCFLTKIFCSILAYSASFLCTSLLS